MTNQKLIDLLDAQVSGGSAQFRTRFYKVGKRAIRYSRSRGRYITVDKNVYSYYVPDHVFKEVTGKKFNPAFKVGDMVRLRHKSTRSYKRKALNQDVGDTYSFADLGIGSGKVYAVDANIDYIRNINKTNKWKMGSNVCLNVKYAESKAKEYARRGWRDNVYLWQFETQGPDDKANGVPRQLRESGMKDTVEIKPNRFLKYTKLNGNGLLGVKKLINGVVTGVFVHFQDPDWVSKREARFEITFETGAKVVFTSDFMDRVYDVDYETDHAIHYCSKSMECVMPFCDHGNAHQHGPECDEGCSSVKDAKCEVLYDYTELGDTTYGKGALDGSDEEK
jgi:hypothetical protein